jgi:hypothetical protein
VRQNEIKAWVGIVKGVRWHNFLEVRSAFEDGDNENGYVIFNISAEPLQARHDRSLRMFTFALS